MSWLTSARRDQAVEAGMHAAPDDRARMGARRVHEGGRPPARSATRRPPRYAQVAHDP